MRIAAAYASDGLFCCANAIIETKVDKSVNNLFIYFKGIVAFFIVKVGFFIFFRSYKVIRYAKNKTGNNVGYTAN